MNQIDNLFCNQIDFSLYHYTGISSLLGITETKKLWASSISYLNDSEEFIHAIAVMERVLTPHLAFGNENDPEYKFSKQLHSWVSLLKHTGHPIFIFSFSEVASLLSQWRSYTPHGKGVSLEFLPKKLNEIIDNSDFKLARCVYSEKDQDKVISTLISMLLESFRQNLSEIDTRNLPPDNCYYGFINQYARDICQVLAIIKHSAFSEEREWRLISSYKTYESPEIKFREGASMLVPYIDIDLKSKPYFGGIFLGPSLHQDLSYSSLSMFLNKHQIAETIVTPSIPYREW